MNTWHARILCAVVAAIPLISHSQERARFAVNVGYSGQSSDADAAVSLDSSSIAIPCQGPRCAEIETSNDDGGAAIGFSWYLTPTIALELRGSQGRTSATEIDVERAPDIGLTKYKAQPVALTAQYHFRINERFTPFAGLGWQKTSVSGVSGNPDVSETDGLRIDDADGVAAVVGLDVNFGD